MVLGLQIIREIVQALLRAWNKKDEGNSLENAAQTSTASDDGTASQSTGTPSRLANVRTVHGRPLNAARLRAVEHRCLMPTVMGHCGTAKTTPPGQGAAIFRLAKKAQQQEKRLPEIRCKRSSEVNWQSRPATSPLAGVAT